MKKFNPKKLFLRASLLILGLILFAFLSQGSETTYTVSDPFFMTFNPKNPQIGKHLLSYINQAQRSVDIQIYALSDPYVIEALNKKGSNVDVTIYYEGKASPRLPSIINQDIKLSKSKTRALMHRKIAIIDKELILAGSSNFTPTSLYWHSNLLFGIKSYELASFLNENKRGKKEFSLGTCYLLPDLNNQALKQVLQNLKQANQSIKIAMFAFSHPAILNELLECIDQGVKVELYLDPLNFKNPSELLEKLIKKAEAVFIQKKGILLHHKLCFIDEKIIITGSSNWSKSGFKKNEEVLFIFDKLEEKQIEPMKDLFDGLKNDLEPYQAKDAA